MKTKIGKVLALLSILIVITTVINFLGQVQYIASPRSLIHDRRLIAALNDLSAQVPDDAVLVVSGNAPFVAYFTRHQARIPLGTTSIESLVEYMRERDYNYLVVFEGTSQVEQLKTLFSSKGIEGLNQSFERIASFQTDFCKIHLYRLKIQA